VTISLQPRATWLNAQEQAELGQEARAYYNRSVRANQPATRAFDFQMESLFDSIEAGSDDIDGKIATLHDTWKHEFIFDKLKDGIKMDHLHQHMFHWVRSRERKLKTDSARQMTLNWNRMRLITSPEPGYTILAAWVGPAAPLAMAAVGQAEPAAELSPNPSWDDGVVTDA
jgi:hypothetical protein